MPLNVRGYARLSPSMVTCGRGNREISSGLYLVIYSRGAQVDRDNDGHGEYQDRKKTGNYHEPEMFSFEI